MLELLAGAVPLAIVASVPLLFAVEGELLVQRSGMINLGIEGMLLSAAFGASLGAGLTGSIAGGVAGGIAGSAIVAAIFGLFAIALCADQIVTGAALNLLALGLTAFVYRELQGRIDAPPAISVDLLTPTAWLVVPALLAILLWRTSSGLRIRAAGENPAALLAARRSVAAHRWLALTVEALLAGLAGAHLALALSNGFAENMSAGRGYIALAVVIFGRWRVKGALVGTAVFGIAAALQYALQAAGTAVPFHLLLATPYLVTLLILCGVAGRVRAPEALGKY
ncbi:MAG TPA: ABC transporter permease [Thermoanaerobaculia bacterium]|nr:ABC transporter permease [Thermoanaerobaculia bacterium]